MNFEWNDYLTVANEWAAGADTNSHPAAVYRSVISRSYYAIFHAAFDLAQALGLQATRSAGDHFRLRQFFQSRGRVANQLSIAIRRLYDLRISADYVLAERNQVTLDPQAAALRSLELAQQALTAIEYLQPKNK